MTGRAVVLRGDARSLPLPDNSVDLVVTSPPYWALRSYTDGGEHYEGQIGSESTPRDWLASMVECTREWMRVLKPSGSLFVNLGDKYSQRVASRPSSHQDGLFPGRPELLKDWKRDRELGRTRMPYDSVVDDQGNYVPEKSLIGLPWRYAFAVMDNLGLTLRAEIVWSKPNPLPESVGDRVCRTHEQVFHFTAQERYFAATDLIRETHTGGAHAGRKDGRSAPGLETRVANGVRGGVHPATDPGQFNPLGRLPRSVWEIPSQPLVIPDRLAHARCCGGVKREGCQDGLAHYAAFPMELPRRVIRGWSPAGICLECGEGRFPVVDAWQELSGRSNSGRAKRQLANGIALSRGFNSAGYPQSSRRALIDGYACACTPYTDHPERRRPSVTPSRMGVQDQDVREALGLPRHHGDDFPQRLPVRDYHLDEWEPPPARPAVVLDPFGGTGTTAVVAAALGRIGVTVDRSADYCRIAQWRVKDRGEIAKAMQVRKPPPEPYAVDGLFDLAELEPR